MRESEQIWRGLLCGLHCCESVLHLLCDGDVPEHIHDGAQPKTLLTSEPGFIHSSLQVMDKRSAKKVFSTLICFPLLQLRGDKRGMVKEVKRLLEQPRVEITEEHKAVEKIQMTGWMCWLRTAEKHLSSSSTQLFKIWWQHGRLITPNYSLHLLLCTEQSRKQDYLTEACVGETESLCLRPQQSLPSVTS